MGQGVKISELAEKMGLKNLTPDVDLANKRINVPEVNRPALQLTGFFDHFAYDRVQIVGYVEYTYLQTLEEDRKQQIYDELLSRQVPCIVFSRNLEPEEELLELARSRDIPVMQTSRQTSAFMGELIRWMNVKLAPCITIHGVLVDVYGVGVLIMGESGIGKSEAALELIKRGHRLVTDDVVEIRKVSDDTLVGSAPDITKHFIELRGIGIVDVKSMFGVQCVRETQNIDLVITLEEWNRDKEYDRLGLEENYTEFLGKGGLPQHPDPSGAESSDHHGICGCQPQAEEDGLQRGSGAVQAGTGESCEKGIGDRVMKYCYGVDIGGTTVKMGLFEENGNILDKWEIVTRVEDEGKEILPDIAASILEKTKEHGLEKTDIIGIGAGVPAPVTADGIVNGSANLGWIYKEVKRELEELTGITSVIGNDANVAALGEMWKGGGAGQKNMVMITLGTGVGGGVIINGRVITGEHGAGGEVGHLCVNYDEPDTCGCGNHGCLEQYASATGIVRLAKKRLERDTRETVLKKERVTAKDVFDAVKAGDAVAIDVAEEFGKYLAAGLINLAVIADPAVIVIGGGVSKAGEILIPFIEKPYREKAFFANREIEFKLATLGNDAGICGSAKMMLDA